MSFDYERGEGVQPVLAGKSGERHEISGVEVRPEKRHQGADSSCTVSVPDPQDVRDSSPLTDVGCARL